MNSIDEIYKAIGSRVKAKREQADLKQDQLAERVGLTRTSISNIENGRQRIQVHTLFMIAEALNVPVETLLPLNLTEEPEEIDEQVLRNVPKEEHEWVKRVLSSEKRG